MPRAFLIKKKSYGLSSPSVTIGKPKKATSPSPLALAQLNRDYVASKLASSSNEDNIKAERQLDSETESGCFSTSSRSPSPSPHHPQHDEVPATAAALITRPGVISGDMYGRPTILEPLNLNAAAAAAGVPYFKSFLPYLPFNYPYLPYHHHHHLHPHSDTAGAYPPQPLPPPSHHHHSAFLSASGHHQQTGHVPRGSPYHSPRSELPSPSYPCPLSPYTPPSRDASTDRPPQLRRHEADAPSPVADEKKAMYLRLKGYNGPASSVSPASGSWSEPDRCSSNGSSSSSMHNIRDERDELCPSKTIHEHSRPQASPLGSPMSKGSPLTPTALSAGRRPSGHSQHLQHHHHQDSATSGPRYQCPDCNKSYSTYSGLSKHQQFHCSTTNKKSFSCKYCEKVYMSLGALKMHIRTHTLPCKCELCGKAFSRPWLLQGHIRTHTGEKPFSCPHCNRAFADRSNLRAHLQTHSDVKKYSCKTCVKTFSRMSLLLKHEDGGCCSSPTATVGSHVTAALVQERLGPQ